jgi:hypothetical protein
MEVFFRKSCQRLLLHEKTKFGDSHISLFSIFIIFTIYRYDGLPAYSAVGSGVNFIRTDFNQDLPGSAIWIKKNGTIYQPHPNGQYVGRTAT